MSKSSSSSAKTTATVTAKQQQHAFAPGIAKRQSHSEWMGGRKSLGEYARLPKLSPTNDNIIITPPGNSSGRLSSQMSAGSSRSSTSASGDLHGNNGSGSGNNGSGSGNNGVLFDDSIAAEEGRENFARNGGNDSGRRNKFTLDDGFLQGEAAGASSVPFPGLVKPLTKSPDILSVESARVAQRLASASSPSSSNPSVRTANLISFKEEQPADLLLVDTGDRDSTQGKHNGGGGSVVANVWDRPNTLIAPTATPLANKSNGFADAKNVRPRTSLETIRQQIRQIESEIRVSNGTRQQQQQQHALSSRHDNFGDGFLGLSRPIQPSFSSQSIPANFDSCDYESSSLSPHGNRHHNYHHQRSGSHNKFLPHMQRAYSVDVAVHSAISDIQSAVRRNSMIRLKSSTNALQQAGIEEEEDNVWVKRDSSAQTEMQEVADESPQHLVVPAPVPALLSPVTPETDEEMENESRQLLSHENGGEDGIGGGGGGVSGINCDNRIGSLSRPLSARRPSCQSAHDLIEGVLFRCCYLGSTHLFSDSRPTKSSRLNQAQEAVTRIKAPDGESQPMTDVDLFISMEKIMVLNVDIQDILMDHPLRTISYIADIGDLVVLMVKRGLEDLNCDAVLRSTQPKMLCHVFQSDEASMIAQTIGNAFQVAYMEYLKANGIQDDRYLRHLDYLEVLNSQEMSTNELDLFASKDKQMNVVIPKQKGEILGVVIVESGWGSMLPTVIIANLCPGGPGARCGKLSIGDQLISINGISLVGLPLAQCQTTIKNVKTHTVVKLTIVSCPPVVEVKIKRPDTRYQLGFSVQNGIICSLLRGGIAERGGIRVGHRIIEINNQSVVATNHENIVNMLAHSVGEIELKTMPSSIFRLLTGQDTPVYI